MTSAYPDEADSTSLTIPHHQDPGAKTIRVGSSAIWSLAFLEEGRHMIGGGSNNRIQRWQVEDCREVGEAMKMDDWVNGVAVSENGRWIVCGTRDGAATVWDVSTHKRVVQVKGHALGVGTVDISPDSTRFATGCGEGTVTIWHISTGQRLVGPMRHLDSIASVNFSPDGVHLAIAVFDHSIHVRNSNNGDLFIVIPVMVRSYFHLNTNPLAWSSDGRQIFAISDGKIRNMEVSTGSLLDEWPIHSSSIPASIALARTGKFIVACAARSVTFWDVDTHIQMGPVINHSASPVAGIALSPNADYLASGSNDGEIIVSSLRNILPRSYYVTPSIPEGPPAETTMKERAVEDSTNLQDEQITVSQLIERSKERAEQGLWEAALHDANHAITLDPSCPWGYERRYKALHCLQRYDEASRALGAMILQIENSPNPDIRELRKDYVSPFEKIKALNKAIHETINKCPLVAIDIKTGYLCDRQKRIRIFLSEPIVLEQLSSITTTQHAGRIPPLVEIYFQYVMFSHVWEGEEPSYQDLLNKSVWDLDSSPLNDKLRKFCDLVRDAGYRWAWSDTCCIDKGTSAILNQSLTSMYKWYEDSVLTLVFLVSVVSPSKPGDLVASSWMTRAWTLQELLAPRVIRFYDRTWKPYLNDARTNHKESPIIIRERAYAIHIALESIIAFRPNDLGVREKLRLASTRNATVEEDVAYALIGIFESDIKPNYGEREAAIGHLLEEIVARSGEVAVLAWTGKSSAFNSCLPATMAVYNQSLYSPPTIEESEMETYVAELRSTLPQREAESIYDRIMHLPPARFANRRLHLPCITFRVRSLSLSVRKSGGGYVYQAKTMVLGDVEIKTTDQLPLAEPRKLLLVHPWIRDLLAHAHALDNWEDYSDAGSDYHTAPSSPSSAEPFLPHDNYSRALHSIVRLRRPFSAFLLEHTSHHEYRRITTEHDIVAQVRNIASSKDIKTDVLEIL